MCRQVHLSSHPNIDMVPNSGCNELLCIRSWRIQIITMKFSTPAVHESHCSCADHEADICFLCCSSNWCWIMNIGHKMLYIFYA
jgi:hypothetical protein